MKPDPTRKLRWFLIVFGLIVAGLVGSGPLLTLAAGKHGTAVIEKVDPPSRGMHTVTLRLESSDGTPARYNVSTRTGYAPGVSVDVVISFSGDPVIYEGIGTWLHALGGFLVGLAMIAIGIWV